MEDVGTSDGALELINVTRMGESIAFAWEGFKHELQRSHFQDFVEALPAGGPVQAGILLAVSGNLLIACSLALQKWVHKAVEQHKPGTYGRRHVRATPEDKAVKVSTQPLFWVALLGLILGEVGNFAAFGLASPTVVSPLGAVAVIANALIAALWLREPFHMRNLVGLVLTVGGSVTVVLNAPPSITDLSPQTFLSLLIAPPSIIYLAVVLLGIAVLCSIEPRYGHKYALVYIMLCSLLGAITVLCSAAISSFIDHFFQGDSQVFADPIPYLILPVLVSTAVLQLKYLNQAMAHFDASQVVPTYYVTFTLCSISGGGVVYQDFWGFTWPTAFGFIGGCFLCFVGVYLITKKGTVAEQYFELKDADSPAPPSTATTSPAAPPAAALDAGKLAGSEANGSRNGAASAAEALWVQQTPEPPRDHLGLPTERDGAAAADGGPASVPTFGTPPRVREAATLSDGGAAAAASVAKPPLRSYEEVHGPMPTGPQIDADGLAQQTKGDGAASLRHQLSAPGTEAEAAAAASRTSADAAAPSTAVASPSSMAMDPSMLIGLTEEEKAMLIALRESEGLTGIQVHQTTQPVMQVQAPTSPAGGGDETPSSPSPQPPPQRVVRLSLTRPFRSSAGESGATAAPGCSCSCSAGGPQARQRRRRGHSRSQSDPQAHSLAVRLSHMISSQLDREIGFHGDGGSSGRSPVVEQGHDLHHMGLVASGNLLGRGNQRTIFPLARIPSYGEIQPELKEDVPAEHRPEVRERRNSGYRDAR